jgi:V8-like Glu-specific endopeptidase
MTKLRALLPLSITVILAGTGISAGLALPAAARTATPPAVSCQQLMTVAFSPAAENAALAYWTPQRMITASASATSEPVALAPDMAVGGALDRVPAVTTQCAAASPATQAPATAATATGSAAALPAVAPDGSFGGYPSVGKVFISNLSGATGPCTGSVFNGSSKKNNESLVLTAAHCIFGVRKGRAYLNTSAIFAPKWANGKSPYGRWTVDDVIMVSGWVKCPTPTTCYTHPEWDYAILIVKKLNGREIGQVTGQNSWRITKSGTVRNVRLVGYPGTASKPLTNTATAATVRKSGQLYWQAASPGFLDGTSGGPWLVSFNARDDLGTLITEVGGWDEGGPTASPSYGPLWDGTFSSTVARAVKDEG